MGVGASGGVGRGVALRVGKAIKCVSACAIIRSPWTGETATESTKKRRSATFKSAAQKVRNINHFFRL